MAAALIYRHSLNELIQEKIPFTALPNILLNHGEIGLKPRDASVFNYLLSKPESWNINPKAIANSLLIGESTARRALSSLVKLGFASYQRFNDGKTKWSVKLPENYLTSLDKSPHSQKPHAEKPQAQISSVLETNNLLEKNKKTTNPVVVFLPDYVNSPIIEKELSTLEAKTQALVLEVLAKMMIGGAIKSPKAYIMGLINKAKDGLLTAPVDNTVVKAVDKKQADKAGFNEFMRKNYARMKQDFITKSVVSSLTWGRISYTEFRDFERSFASAK